LLCDGTTGLISGTPIRTGTYLVRVKASNLFASVFATISFTIDNGAIISADSVEAVISAPFFFQIIADNDPDLFSVSGLPSGLICDVRTGLISGTPIRTGTFAVHIKAGNLFGSTSDTLTITIRDSVIISARSAAGIAGTPFVYRIVANNNPTWYSARGLPSGLICDGRTGLISGTPGRTGTNSVEVIASNLFSSASAVISIVIGDGKIGVGSFPTLSALRSNESYLLTWPGSYDGFVLEELAETEPGSNSWTNSTVKVAIQGNENVAVIPTSGPMKFFRLRK
jgi:hypothetical protein